MAYPVDIGPCCECKEPMWMTREAHQTYLRNHQTFYCIHGHPQHFTEDKSEAQKLREQLDAERQARQRAEQRVAEKSDEAQSAWRTASAYKGQVTRLKNRSQAGVCPCCNRTFKQLVQHMANKHPDYASGREDR